MTMPELSVIIPLEDTRGRPEPLAGSRSYPATETL